MSPAKGARRRPYHHGDLRSALEGAALELVTERGVEGLTLAEASRRAGVSVAAPFRHFASKEALLVALAVRGYEAQRTRFAAAVAQSADPVEQMALFAAAYVQFAVDERGLFDVTFAVGHLKVDHSELEGAGQRVLDVLRGPAERLRTAPDDALELIQAVGATAHGFAAFLRQGVFGEPDGALEAAKRRASQAARAIVAAGPAPGR